MADDHNKHKQRREMDSRRCKRETKEQASRADAKSTRWRSPLVSAGRYRGFLLLTSVEGLFRVSAAHHID